MKLNDIDFTKANIALESFEGTFIVLNGCLPYIFKVKDYNAFNNIFKLNLIDGRSKYFDDNIVQKNNEHTFSGYLQKNKFFN